MKKEEIMEYLIEKNVKPSMYRMRILENMMKNKNHPTADMIYSEIVKDIPTMSKTTVYNTVDMFLKNGVIQMINIDNYEKRYDADITTHGHFMCEDCGNIFDFPVDFSEKNPKCLDEFEIKQKHLYYTGKCKECTHK